MSDSTKAKGILLADDEPDVRRFLALALRSRGYLVFEASDGTEALRVAATHFDQIDAVVTDVQMPGVNGIELASLVRYHNPLMKLIFISGGTELPLDSEDFFLRKPFGTEEFLQSVGVLLGKAA